MYLLIPFASARSEGCQALLPKLSLPHLDKLLARLQPQALDSGDEYSWSPPHERALAKALGWPHPDGQIPLAAARAREIKPSRTGSEAWAFMNLCHWQASTFEVSMRQIPMMDLSAAESDELQATMAPFLAQDGITLHSLEPGQWLAQAEVFAGLRCASPDRVQGRNLEPWLPSSVQTSGMIRLLSEMQMLLYTHPVNEARQARGLLTANALWFSGAGVLPDGAASPTSSAPQAVTELKAPALAEDWPAWQAAWQQLDHTVVRELLTAQTRGEPVTLTLCGERHAQTWQSAPLGLLQKLKAQFAGPRAHSALEKL